jgi:DNA gyrase subunit A
MKRFELDEEQVDAILELKLYRLARLEILMIQQELEQKRKEAKRISGLLANEGKRWALVKDELSELVSTYGDKRKTKVSVSADEPEYDANAFIVDEDANVVLTRDGWVKRVREIKDVSSTRTREGDEVMAVLAGNTRNNLVFFTNYGAAYCCKIVDIPPSTGYGDPVQKLFKFDDGERVVAAYSLDPRVKPAEENFVAVSKNGYGLRFGIAPYSEVSTRAGRKFARPAEGDEIVGVRPAPDGGTVCIATYYGHALVLALDEVNVLANPGRGVTVIKLSEDDDRVVGFTVDELLTVESEKGKTAEVKPLKKDRGARATKGDLLWTRKDRAAKIVAPPIVVPQLAKDDGKPDGKSNGKGDPGGPN